VPKHVNMLIQMSQCLHKLQACVPTNAVPTNAVPTKFRF